MKTSLKFSLLAALVMATGKIAAADTPVTVAVYDFKGHAAAANYAKNVTTLVTADLTMDTNLNMVERAELTKALNEQAFGASGMVNSDMASQIGQITGAKVLVTGQVIIAGKEHVIIVANIIGTETARLFAAKVEGAPDSLTKLTSDLSQKIAQTISDELTNLVSAAAEPDADRLADVIKNLSGTNRPSVSVDIHWPQGHNRPNTPANTEFGVVLLKAGFTVADSRADRKPDVDITGQSSASYGPAKNGLASCQENIFLKVQDRRSGQIITLEHQSATVSDSTQMGAQHVATIQAVDLLAERILPFLANGTNSQTNN